MSEETLQERLAWMRHARERAFEDVVEAHENLVIAKEEYDEALLRAHDLGVTNMRLGRAFKQSETAVRSYIKRRKVQYPSGKK